MIHIVRHLLNLVLNQAVVRSLVSAQAAPNLVAVLNLLYQAPAQVSLVAPNLAAVVLNLLALVQNHHALALAVRSPQAPLIVVLQYVRYKVTLSANHTVQEVLTRPRPRLLAVLVLHLVLAPRKVVQAPQALARLPVVRPQALVLLSALAPLHLAALNQVAHLKVAHLKVAPVLLVALAALLVARHLLALHLAALSQVVVLRVALPANQVVAPVPLNLLAPAVAALNQVVVLSQVVLALHLLVTVQLDSRAISQ